MVAAFRPPPICWLHLAAFWLQFLGQVEKSPWFSGPRYPKSDGPGGIYYVGFSELQIMTIRAASISIGTHSAKRMADSSARRTQAIRQRRMVPVLNNTLHCQSNAGKTRGARHFLPNDYRVDMIS